MQAARGAPLTPADRSGSTGGGRGIRPKTLFVVVAAAAYCLDVVSKILAVRHLTDRPDVSVLGDLLTLSLVRNPGAAFSTATGLTHVLSALAFTAIVVVLWFATQVGDRRWAVALGLLLAGVAGNFTDRVFREPGFLKGHVVDFFRLPHWPVFNVADICIDAAAILILVLALRGVPLRGPQPSEAEA